MKIGLFLGSFNPVHVGHMVVANYCLEFTDLDEIWMVVSPQNPLKVAYELMPENKRLEMLNVAVSSSNLPIKVSDVEMNLPKPSYTIDTLDFLSKENPDKQFCIIMGADNLSNIEKWKSWEDILKKYPTYVYPRVGFDAMSLCKKYNVHFIAAPIIEVSSTFIREGLAAGKKMNAFLPKGVAELL
ncbi:MAG: nicotinate-nucleotide adenylyltransferase [Prevotellaceae bacterium]|jgi:nicotinate-nucleotide adenylyltransferase|nr:nicotinate-nucleotide adenylyltransferase [Prevotellaceae bacterium]